MSVCCREREGGSEYRREEGRGGLETENDDKDKRQETGSRTTKHEKRKGKERKGGGHPKFQVKGTQYHGGEAYKLQQPA